MPKRLVYDKVLFLVTLGLVAFGLVMVFSASALLAVGGSQSPYGFLMRQGVGAALGVGLLLGAMRVDYRRLKSPAVVYSALCVTVLLLVVVFLLDRSHNTHRWIRLSALGGISLQPSELAKPVVVLFLAFFLESRLATVATWATLRPILLCVGLVCVLILAEPDLGTTVAIVLASAAVLHVAGLRLRSLALAAVCASPALYLLVFHVHYRKERILAFLHPWRDAAGASFQVVQSLIAVGTGGLTGLGLMNSHQKLFFLPEPQTDFIFAVVGEEFGLIGSALVVLAFVVFLFRGMRVARAAPDNFGRLLAVGITSMVVIQALINFSVVSGLVPTKGIPLPFISYGGSSLVFTLLGVGILLNVSQHSS